MLDLLTILLTRLAAGEPVALCVLVRARGSTPQATGAMMLVLANGESLGTLGGGCVEAEMKTRALRAIAEGRSLTRLNSFKLDHDFGWDDGLMCGGSMDVVVWSMRTIEDATRLVAVRGALAAKQATSLSIEVLCEAGEHLSFELPFAPRPTLVIAGAGHVGQAIATMAAACDFDVVVIDDRADITTAARFPTARRIIGPIDRELGQYPIDAHTYVVIVTRGHKNDAAALGAVVTSPAAYVGMIGSKRKVRTILEGLEKTGVPRQRLSKVHAPIGLEIGAITPGEIAVSVCAELIAVRRGLGGQAAVALKIGADELVRWLDRDDLSSRNSQRPLVIPTSEARRDLGRRRQEPADREREEIGSMPCRRVAGGLLSPVSEVLRRCAPLDDTDAPTLAPRSPSPPASEFRQHAA